MMQPGDEMDVLFGERMPFVVHPRSDHQVFVGNCYVRNDGLKWGKMTEKADSREGASSLHV
jgi:hypothetical protein